MQQGFQEKAVRSLAKPFEKPYLVFQHFSELILERVVIKPHVFKFDFPFAKAKDVQETNTGLAASTVEIEISSVEDMSSPEGYVDNKILTVKAHYGRNGFTFNIREELLIKPPGGGFSL
jgi:hypothetical protein